MEFEYRSKILAALVAHGVRPTTATPPALVKDHVTALYLYELRALRAAMMRDEFPKREYAERVARLRERYHLLSLPSERWATQA